ncbi:sporulation protein YabP [Caloramator sp. mosi_1]|uniref:sporulation protein YabP n=1 Tax=Caloramator sp. mosi_1 TaxID=3023090 RepID=UPI0023614397|nr:sporulation protein YabP [Caloramator sp. mosi_1]WDC85473.1 sporulation protein YabP [Caloramator sp. mosi_1]
MENNKMVKNQNHNLNMINRQKLDITGVLNVINFNEEQINLSTIMGNMLIKGKNMKINRLNVDNGDMCIEGEITAINYLNKQTNNSESIFKKLFK